MALAVETSSYSPQGHEVTSPPSENDQGEGIRIVTEAVEQNRDPSAVRVASSQPRRADRAVEKGGNGSRSANPDDGSAACSAVGRPFPGPTLRQHHAGSVDGRRPSARNCRPAMHTRGIAGLRQRNNAGSDSAERRSSGRTTCEKFA